MKHFALLLRILRKLLLIRFWSWCGRVRKRLLLLNMKELSGNFENCYMILFTSSNPLPVLVVNNWNLSQCPLFGNPPFFFFFFLGNSSVETLDPFPLTLSLWARNSIGEVFEQWHPIEEATSLAVRCLAEISNPLRFSARKFSLGNV